MTLQLTLSGIPDASTVRLRYAGRHRCDAVESTLPDADLTAIAYLAASIICDQLAASYASQGEPTIMADSVNQARPEKAWAERAKAYRQLYAGLLAGQESPQLAAAAVVSFAPRDSRGRRRLTHPLPIPGGENL